MPEAPVIETPAAAAAPIEGGDVGRDALLAELEKIPDTSAVPIGAVTPADEPPEDPAPEEPADEAVPEPVEDPADALADDDAPEPAAAKVDAETAKRLEVIQRTERRAKEAIAREREAVEKERAELAPLREQVERFKRLAERFKYDPTAVARELGASEDDFESIAKSLYAQGKAAAADPKLREQAARALREREHADGLEKTRQELSALRAEIAQEREQAQVQRQIGEYLDAATKAAGDDTPLVRNMIAKRPDLARQRIRVAAQVLAEETGEQPDPADVIKALEQVERDDLEARGIDYSTVVAQAKKPATAATRPAKTLSATMTPPTPAPRAVSKDPEAERLALIRELENIPAT